MLTLLGATKGAVLGATAHEKRMCMANNDLVRMIEGAIVPACAVHSAMVLTTGLDTPMVHELAMVSTTRDARVLRVVGVAPEGGFKQGGLHRCGRLRRGRR